MEPRRAIAWIVVIAILSPLVGAVRGDRAEYVGGTIKTIKAGRQGILSLDDKKNLVFDCGKGALVQVPYADIQSMEFGQKVGRRVGSTIALGVTTIGVMALPMLLSKKKNHFLTVTYSNDQGESEVLVLELAKGIVRTTIPVLEARTGKRVELQENEFSPARADKKNAAVAKTPAPANTGESVTPAVATTESPAAQQALGRLMTNQDVIALKTAGFTDDLVVAKIEASKSRFKVDTDDIISLKASNLSERVIQAMLAAATPATQMPEAASGNTGEAQKRGVVAKLKGAFSTSSDGEHPKGPVAPLRPAEPATPAQFALCPVSVISKPAGAAIFVDGYPAGSTPAIVKLQPGTYKLTLKAEGLPAYSQQLVVEPGQVRSFGVVLDISK